MSFFNKTFLILLLSVTTTFAEDPSVVARDLGWIYVDVNTTRSANPTDLKYFKFYDVMPDEITIPIVVQQDLGAMAGKNLVVGYGIADPRGQDCRLFQSSETGLENNVTVCLPWWRIEREYQRTTNTLVDPMDILCSLPTPKPPIKVNVCKTWSATQDISREGGRATCTSYYDKLKDVNCWNNPMQERCFVNNCSTHIQDNCNHVGSEMGETTALLGVEMLDTRYENTQTKVNLVSYQYECPAGIYMPNTNCQEEISVLMFPYTCSAPTGNSNRDDGVYIYCDEKMPQYDGGGGIVGFLGTCPGGEAVMCEVNSFANTNKVCTEPIMADITKINYIQEDQEITCTPYALNIISGEPDLYSSNDRCLRKNSVAESRMATSAHIVGSGWLDDDIYVLKHRSDGSHYKVYCNMQHGVADANVGTILDTCLASKGFDASYRTLDKLNCSLGCFSDADNTNPSASNVGECLLDVCGLSLNTSQQADFFDCRSNVISTGASPKNYNGTTLLCERNDGTYAFDQMMDIQQNDIVSIQEATEEEISTSTHFYARTHYGSSQVTIDDVIAAPSASYLDYPFYPQYTLGWLTMWDNSLGSLSLMFPYAGAYKIYFYTKSGENLITKTLGYDDFQGIGNSFISLQMAKDAGIAPGRTLEDPMNCWDDDLAEIGGGVFGGKKSRTGEPCYLPDDAYSVSHAINNVIVEDLLTGEITNIPLVYPMVYLNKIYISKLKLYEHREYCCYNNF